MNKLLSCSTIILMFILTIQLVRNPTLRKASLRLAKQRNPTPMKEPKMISWNPVSVSSLNKQITPPIPSLSPPTKWHLPIWLLDHRSLITAMTCTTTKPRISRCAIGSQSQWRKAEDSPLSTKILRMMKGRRWWWRIFPTSTRKKCCWRSLP